MKMDIASMAMTAMGMTATDYTGTTNRFRRV
jgi:hypothetical protein